MATGLGEKPTSLYSVAVGAVRLTEIFGSSGKVSDERLAVMRSYAAEAFRETLPRRLARPAGRARLVRHHQRHRGGRHRLEAADPAAAGADGRASWPG